ncbi:MAG: type II secretion system minor pseudopilin GspI [Halioglobus sp.]|nr:type II secretion system minor pseudopilin GspI [Halioglobus sp.]
MRVRGFTLVEVMVALAIVAIALPVLLMTLSQQTDDTAYLRDKTFAQMVAANKLAEMRLVIGATRSVQPGKSNGVATLLDRDWHWWVQTLPTPMENLLRVEISVALDSDLQDQPLYLLTAFMNSDLAEDNSQLGFGPPDDPNDP